MFSRQKRIWSVYRVAGEAYGSKLIGHYCMPSTAYVVALSKQLNKCDEDFNVFVKDIRCIREELHKLQYDAVNSKHFLNKTIYHVKEAEYIEGLHIHTCTSCSSAPPTCLR